MSNQNGLKSVITCVSFLVIATFFLLLYMSTEQISVLHKDRAWTIGIKMTYNKQSNISQELGGMLRKATMDDRTVIITTVNEAWATPGSIFDLFLHSFRVGEGTKKLLDHLVVAALDAEALDRCRSVHKNCFLVTTKGGKDFSNGEGHRSHDYLEMMWTKLEFLKSVLELGYSFIFTDSDIMWLRNPLPLLPNNAHLAVASDMYFHNPTDRRNLADCGFVYAKSNFQTIEFYKYWLMSRRFFPNSSEQQILNTIKRDSYVTRLGVGVRFLDTTHFGGLCQPSKDFDKLCTVHANCCLGMDSRVHDLRGLLRDWEDYKAKSKMKRSVGDFSWSVPSKCKKVTSS